MTMANIVSGLQEGTRDLDMEVLCSIPPVGTLIARAGRRTWTRGVSVVGLAKDLAVTTDDVRGAVKRLGEIYMVRTGVVAPRGLAGGETLDGGHCAFVRMADWHKVEAVCEAYMESHP